MLMKRNQEQVKPATPKPPDLPHARTLQSDTNRYGLDLFNTFHSLCGVL